MVILILLDNVYLIELVQKFNNENQNNQLVVLYCAYLLASLIIETFVMVNCILSSCLVRPGAALQ